MRPWSPGLVASSILVGLIVMGLVVFVYAVPSPTGLILGGALGVVAAAGFGFLILNQQKNIKESRKRGATSFPNPKGGGILGEYMYRNWREELAEIAAESPKRSKPRKKRET